MIFVFLTCAVPWILFVKVHSECNIANRFGDDCKYMCRCKSQSACNNITGECDGGCAAGWMGQSCQYVNVAHQKPVNGENNTTLTDADYETSKTLEISTDSILSLDLGFGIFVKSLIVYAEGNVRQNYSIDVTCNQTFNNRKVCLTNIPVGVETRINCEKEHFGRFVNIRFQEGSDERTINIYEIEVSGGQIVSLHKDTIFYTNEAQTHKSVTFLTDGDTGDSAQSKWCDTHLNISSSSAANVTVSLVKNYTIIYCKIIFNKLENYITNFTQFIFPKNGFPVIGSTISSETHHVSSFRQLLNTATVSVRFPGGNYDILQLCAVDVFAYCEGKSFGPDCTKTCNCGNFTEECGDTDCPIQCRKGQAVQCGSSGQSSTPRVSTTSTDGSTHVTTTVIEGQSSDPNDSSATTDKSTKLSTIASAVSDQTTVSSNGASGSGKEVNKDTDLILIIAVVAGGVVFIAVVILVACLLWRRHKKRKSKPTDSSPLYVEPIEGTCDREHQARLRKAQQQEPGSTRSSNSEKKTEHFSRLFENPVYSRHSEVVDETVTDNSTSNENAGTIEPHNDSPRDSGKRISITSNLKTEDPLKRTDDQAKRILVDDLSDFVNKRMASKIEFEQEFKTLPSGMVNSFSSAKANMKKNRYKGIYAYDHSRVQLAPDQAGETDYINANYVQTFDHKNVYIASQGTTKENVHDFWRMIWQARCKKVIMLTREAEGGLEKCTRYWPEENTTCTFGNVLIYLKKEEIFTDFIIRKFKIRKDQEQRYLWHFQYTTWPDKSVPKYPSSLVYFLRKVRMAKESLPRCWIVHCSAGVGRTGTFLALDFLHEQASTEGYVDIFGCVKKMREQRVNMIQTLDQYIFLHAALVEALNCKSHAMSCSEFVALYQNKDDDERQEFVETNFTNLDEIYTDTVKTFNAAKHPDNIDKNRSLDILPADIDRPHLNTRLKGRSDYINAVILSGLRKKNQFVVTQSPMANTVLDFWRLVSEQKCNIIVDLNNDRKGVPFYPTDTSSIQSGPFVVTLVDTEEKHHWTVYNVKMNDQSVAISLKILAANLWEKDNPVPSDILQVREFLEDVRSMHDVSDRDKPVIVTCLNGAERCGLLCTLWVSLDRLEVDQEVAVGHLVKEFRKIRRHFVPTVVQLKFCYDFIMQYINEHELYSNFT